MPSVRAATESDLPSILAIYNEVIATSTAVYALEPATLDERCAWFTSRSARGFPVVVAAAPGGDVLGFPPSGIGAVHGPDIATRSNIRCMSEPTFVDGASDAPLSSPYFLWLSARASTS